MPTLRLGLEDAPLLGVTVYPGGAELEREIELRGSVSELELAGLPPHLLPSSVQARVIEPRSAWVSSLHAEPEPPGRDEDELASLRLRAEELEARLECLEERLEALAELEPLPRPEEAAEESPGPARLALLALRRERAEVLRAELRRLQGELERCRQQVEELEARGQESPRWRLRLVVEGHRGGRLRISLRYRSRGANWAPAYALRLEDGEARLELRAWIAQSTGEDWAAARVSVTTARPVEQVELPELPPLRIARRRPPPPPPPPPPPKPDPWRDFDRAAELEAEAGPAPMAGEAGEELEPPALEEAVEALPPAPLEQRVDAAAAPLAATLLPPAPAPPRKTPRKRRLAARARPGLAGVAEEAEELDLARLHLPPGWEEGRGQLQPLPEPPSPPPPRLAAPPPGCEPPRPADGHHHRWDGPAARLPSDGRYRAVPLFSVPLEARYHYLAVPRAAPTAYASLRAPNPLPHPLPPGPLDVLREDALSTSRLDGVPPGGELELGLGPEEAISIQRHARFRERQGGVLSGHRLLEHHVELSVCNGLPHPVDLELRERLPVAPESPELRVQLERVDPPWEDWPPERGGLRGGHRWLLRLEAGETRRLELAYTIRLPADRELVGGNDREA